MGLCYQVIRNDHDSAHIQAARQKLAALAPNVKAVLNDEIRAYVTSGRPMWPWSFCVVDYAHALNPDIDYVIPEDGGSVWTDISIPPKMRAEYKGLCLY